ncbi:hypothetical protein NL676_029455 [Syzygium grande]|nr:hypothetical protein NL676_029455 [Syzygium grande]
MTSSNCFKDTEDVALLKQQYGLNESANEVIIVIEAYRTLRDRRPYPADQVVRDITEMIAIVLFHGSPKTTFLAADVEGSIPFFWGSDSEGNLVLSDDAEVEKKGRGKSFPPFPKGLFTVVNDIFGLFQGHPKDVALLKQQYGLNKTANEVIIVIEGYRTLGDQRPYPADQVVRDVTGKFVFFLFDGPPKTTFLVVVRCFFTSSRGLMSYEHPPNEVKPVPRMDSSGQVCGATFKVDAETKESSMPRVGSAAN